VALAIVGVVATYTIPKVLTAQSVSAYNAQTHEVVGMLAEAYQKHLQLGKVTVNTTPLDLIQYINHVRVMPSGTVIDLNPNHVAGASWTCSATDVCLQLHTGGILMLQGGHPMTRLIPNEFLSAFYDPDGIYTGKADSAWLLLYYTGRVSSGANLGPNDCISIYCPFAAYASAGNDPSWLRW
jgi:hypothetical protein